MATAPRGAILVVDDEPTIAEVVGRYLERASYSTRSVGDGKQALELARADPPDLVVLDLMLRASADSSSCAAETRCSSSSRMSRSPWNFVAAVAHLNGAAATSGARAGEAGIVGSRGSSASIATASLARSR